MQENKSIFTRIIDSVKEHYVAVLLTLILISSMLEIYGTPFISAINGVLLIGIVLMYTFFDFCKTKGILGTVFCLLFQFAMFMICILIMLTRRPEEQGFFQWFLTAQTGGTEDLRFSIVVAAGFGAFLGSSVYYFTKSLYRLPVIVLVSIIPGVLYVRVYSEMSFFYTAATIILVLLTYTDKCRRDYVKAGELKKQGVLRTSAFIFILAGVLLSDLLPKSEEAKYNYLLEEFFNWSKISMNVQEAVGSMTPTSSPPDSRGSMSGQILYYVDLDEPAYLRTRVFDICEGEYWVQSSAIQNTDEWERPAKRMNLAELCEAVHLAAENDSEYAAKYADMLAVEPYPVRDEISVKVEANRFRSQLLLSPLGVTDIYDIYPEDAGPTIKTKNGEIALLRHFLYVDEYMMPSNHSYSFTYRKEFYPEDAYWYNGIKGLTFNEYKTFLADTKNVLVSGYEAPSYYETGGREVYLTSVADAYVKDCIAADEYKRTNTSSEAISANLNALTNEIIKGCKTDYEKASAIEQFFQSSGFVYDDEQKYSSGTRTADNFVFNIKRGVCTDFANAMTLMCRAAGLPARYTEGFFVFEKNRYGRYVVRDSDAHAFTEVYISGIGWKTFEPTVPSDDDELTAAEMESISKFLLSRAQIILIVLGALLLLYLAWLFLFPVLAERFFRISVKTGSCNNGAIAMYGRMLKKLRRRTNKDLTDITPGEMVNFIQEYNKVDITPLVYAFEVACYSKHTLTKEDFIAAFNCYCACMKRPKKERIKKH